MGKKPLGWFVRRNDTSMLKCTDGKWRHNAGAIENIKIWKHSTNALKYGERGVPDQGELGGVCFSKVTAYAVYEDQPINCYGNFDMSFWGAEHFTTEELTNERDQV